MKFLILFACIAAASAYSSYPFFNKEYSTDYYKYPVTEKYYKDYPVYDKYYKDYPWFMKYFKDEKYFKDFPYYEKYYKSFPYFEKYYKDFPVTEKYFKDFPYYEKFYKSFPYFEKYYKDFPVTEKYFKDFPYYEKFHKSFPYFEKYYKDFPVTEKYFKDVKEFPYFKDFKSFPVEEKFFKDFPLYEKYFKDFNFAEFFGEKEFPVVKKEFVIFYYKYLLELVEFFKVRFGDIITHADSFKYEEFTLPAKCEKFTGFFRWMMMMNIDVTKKDVHFFDYYMMCKFVDYIKFIKNYFYHFNVDVMYKDYGLIRDLYHVMGDYPYGLSKYYYDVFGHDFYKYEPYKPHKFVGKFFAKDIHF